MSILLYGSTIRSLSKIDSDLKNLKYKAEEALFMDIEEIARKYCMRELKPVAKKYGIGTRCVKKIDIIKAFPPEALAELTGEQQ